MTGGGGGIGRELAIRFAENGCILALWDIATLPNEETADLCRMMGVKVRQLYVPAELGARLFPVFFQISEMQTESYGEK